MPSQLSSPAVLTAPLAALPAGGCSVVPLDPHEIEQELQMAAGSAGWDVVRSLQAVLDHHHHSYYQELEAAAIIAYRQQGQQGQQAGGMGMGRSRRGS